MARRIRITYEIITPESSEQGDADERGWVDKKGEVYTLDEAVRFLSGKNLQPSSSHFHKGLWYTEYEYNTDYSTGAVENRSYHLKGFTEREEHWIYTAVTGRENPVMGSIILGSLGVAALGVMGYALYNYFKKPEPKPGATGVVGIGNCGPNLPCAPPSWSYVPVAGGGQLSPGCIPCTAASKPAIERGAYGAAMFDMASDSCKEHDPVTPWETFVAPHI